MKDNCNARPEDHAEPGWIQDASGLAVCIVPFPVESWEAETGSTLDSLASLLTPELSTMEAMRYAALCA